MEDIIDDYFKKPGVSNSFLGNLKNLLQGKPLFNVRKETLDFGSQLHECLLEPHKYTAKVHTPEYQKNVHKIAEMKKSARKNALLCILLDSPDTQFEKEEFFECMGIACKMKADMIKHTIVGDLKTTDAVTREQFLEKAIEYGYMRQGAFYLDGTGCKRFMLFAISKRSPYPTFTYVLDHDDAQIEIGREEYKNLLQVYSTMTEEQLQLLRK